MEVLTLFKLARSSLFISGFCCACYVYLGDRVKQSLFLMLDLLITHQASFSTVHYKCSVSSILISLMTRVSKFEVFS